MEDVYLKNANDKLFVNHSGDEFVKVVEMSVITKKKKRCKQQQPILRTTLTQTARSTITPGFNPFTIRLTIYTNLPKKELFKVVNLKKPAVHFGLDRKHLEKGTFGKQ